MTEKEKAKAYDKAIERAKKCHNAPNIDKMPPYGNRIIEEIFPELKENKDERIKKAIIEFFESEDDNTTYSLVRKKDIIAWLEKQRDKDKLIQELGEYKVKYTQEVIEKYINSTSNKDDERLRKTTIAFLKDFAEQGYENAVECIDWLEKQGEQASSQTNERAWLYLVSDVLTWKDGIGQYLDDPRVQELAKRLCSEYAQKLYNSSILSNSSNTGKNEQKSADKIKPKCTIENQWISVDDDLPKQDEEVIVLCDELNTAPIYKISFGHIVDKTICKDYNGWNIPNVVYWFPMPKLPKE